MKELLTHKRANALAILIIIFFSLLYSSISLWDPDFWWHIDTGKYIIEHKGLPENDYFSFMPEGTDSLRNQVILKGYWLAQIILYEIWNAGGVPGTVMFRTALLTLTLCLLWWYIRRGDPYLSLSNLLLAGNTLFYFTGERPQTLVFPLTILMFMTVQNSLDKKGNSFLFLPALTLVWTNLHGSVIYAMGVLVIYMVCFALPQEVQGRRRTVLLISCFIALMTIFVSPLGVQRITQFITFQKSLVMAESMEFFSPFKILLTYGKIYPSYWICLLVAVLVLILNVKKLPLSTTLVVAASSMLSLLGVRYMVFFALSTSILFGHSALRVNRFMKTGILVIAILPLLLNIPYFRPFNFTIRETFPIDSVRMLKARNPERIFTYLEWGGFVEHYLPSARVFIDGRMLNESTLIQYDITIMGTEAGSQKEWKLNLDKNGVDAVVVPVRDFNTGEPIGLVDRLLKDGDWEQYYFNGREIVFARRQL